MEYSRPPIEKLIEALCYDDGILVWKLRPISHFTSTRGMAVFNAKYAGKQAGTLLHPLGLYRIVWITLEGVKYQLLEHVVVWALAHGEYPPDDIDHKDGNGLNNKIENLQVVNRSRNMHNKRQYRNNGSGHVGVSWYSRYSKWVAQGTHEGKKKTLGYFERLEDAVAARQAWEADKGFSDRHGKLAEQPELY